MRITILFRQLEREQGQLDNAFEVGRSGVLFDALYANSAPVGMHTSSAVREGRKQESLTPQLNNQLTSGRMTNAELSL